MKIAFVGATSTGKTTLAEKFVSTSGWAFPSVQTVDALRAMGLESHSQVKGLGAEGARRFQYELMEQRHRLFAEQARDMVTDRSAIDAWVYYCLDGMAGDTAAGSKEFQERAAHLMDQFDMVMYLPFGAIPHQEDPRRINNPYYHGVTDAIYRQFLSDHVDEGKLHICAYDNVSIKGRVRWVMNRVDDALNEGLIGESYFSSGAHARAENLVLA